MSGAFVKEVEGGRWEAPVVFTYQVREAGEAQVLSEGDDLLGLLRWLEGQERGHFELRDQSGLLLASSGR